MRAKKELPSVSGKKNTENIPTKFIIASTTPVAGIVAESIKYGTRKPPKCDMLFAMACAVALVWVG